MWCSSERIARILITSIASFSSLLLPRSYVGCFTAFSPSPRSSITVQIQQKISLTMVQLTLHSKAVNLARRFTVQNEPDMMRKYFSSEALSPYFLPLFASCKCPSYLYTRSLCLSSLHSSASFIFSRRGIIC